LLLARPDRLPPHRRQRVLAGRDRRVPARGRATRVRVRQPRRLRHGLRPPPRRGRVRRLPGTAGPGPARAARPARRGGLAVPHRRPRLRPDLAWHRPHPRAGADARLEARRHRRPQGPPPRHLRRPRRHHRGAVRRAGARPRPLVRGRAHRPGPGRPAVTALEVIARKRDRGEIPTGQLRALVLAYARGEVPDYQMAAFLMAGYLNGFTRAEARALTEAMVASGEVLDLSALAGPTVDKHSTGGVADGTTLVVAPLAAALGMQVVKLSGRGLGHTGGTLDKLESIPGLRVELTTGELLAQVERTGLPVAAGDDRLGP